MAVTLSSLAGAGAQFFDNNGVPLAGGLIYTYLAGTSTPEATYTSSTGVTAHANPIVLNAAGRIATGEVWLTSGVEYKFIVQTSLFVQLGSYDNIPSINDFTSIYAALANTSNIALGDALIGFKQSNSSGVLSGAVGKTVHQKLQESVSVKDFGAVGDGVTNDTAAVQAAFNYIAANPVALYVPTGSYLLSAQISVTSNKTINVYGDGVDLTVFVWTATATGGGGLSITFTDVFFPPSVQNLTLNTKGLAVGTALLITGVDYPSLTKLGPNVASVSIRGFDTAIHCWDTGINFILCWYPTINIVSIKGKNESVLPFTMSAGITLTSCQVAFITNFVIIHVRAGIRNALYAAIYRDEGHTISAFEIVGVQIGIDFFYQGDAAGTSIGPGHINAYEYGLKFANRFQTAIHDLLIYKTHLSTSNYSAMLLQNCDSNIIHNNQMHGSPTATGDMFGIVLSSPTPNINSKNVIHDNIFEKFYGTGLTCIIVGDGVERSLIHHNSSDSTPTAMIALAANPAKNNIFYANLPTTEQLLAVNSATPSVGNDLNGQWFFTNTVATNVTNFLDFYNTQTIVITTSNNNTTLVASATMVLQGNVNFAMTIYDAITLRRDATLWREVSRMEF